MSQPSQPPKIAIPESLSRQLADFRRHLWRTKALEAVAAGVIGLLVSFLLVFGLERIWPTPAVVRLLILAGGVSLFAVFAPYWLHRWVWKQRREAQLARLIAKRYPGLGDRLLGVIELQGQSETEDSLSPRLREAAMAAVAAETGRRNLDDAVIATGIPHRGRPDHARFRGEMQALMSEVAGLRRTGAASIDLAWTAAGRFDGFWERNLKPWDMAAGIVLIREAGGQVCDLDGGGDMFEKGSILGGNNYIQKALLPFLSNAKPAA